MTRNPNAPRSSTERREAMKKEGWTGVALVILTPIEIVLVLLYVVSPTWMIWANLDLPEVLRWIGLIVTIASIPLAVWAHRTLGKHYSYALETKGNQSIIKVGPYSLVRHPLYSAHTIFNLGMVLLTANIPLIVFAIIGVPIVYARMKSEEAMLIRQFGDEYTSYMRGTGRLFPKIKGSSSGQTEM
jgi:protein-S-isoprenylcysteine O-methyltransferase Ste14